MITYCTRKNRSFQRQILCESLLSRTFLTLQKMHFITIFLASFLLYNLVTSFTIISSNRVFNDFDDDEFAFAVSDTKSVLQSMYVSQEVGKSHRFFFTVGEREDSNCALFYHCNQSKQIVFNSWVKQNILEFSYRQMMFYWIMC